MKKLALNLVVLGKSVNKKARATTLTFNFILEKKTKLLPALLQNWQSLFYTSPHKLEECFSNQILQLVL